MYVSNVDNSEPSKRTIQRAKFILEFESEVENSALKILFLVFDC